MNKTLITGITGQDGIYLTSKLLQQKDNYIYGTTRNKNINKFIENLKSLGATNFSNLQVIQEDLLDQRKIEKLFLNLQPSTVYNFTGPSSVYESLIDNGDSQKQIVEIFDNLISASMKLDNLPNFFQPSSSEMFGPGDYNVLNEDSPFNPISPYAEAKLKNHLRVIELAKNYDWNIKSGIMFNHESEFRSNDFLIMKIISETINIKNSKSSKLTIGSLDYIRDWTYAGEIVQAMYLITNYGKSYDYVLGSGVGTSIKEIVNYVFEYFNLDWEKYIEIDKELLRDNDPIKVVSNPVKIKSELGWQNKIDIYALLDKCIKSKLNQMA